jgi:hypothetical protein
MGTWHEDLTCVRLWYLFEFFLECVNVNVSDESRRENQNTSSTIFSKNYVV